LVLQALLLRPLPGVVPIIEAQARIYDPGNKDHEGQHGQWWSKPFHVLSQQDDDDEHDGGHHTDAETTEHLGQHVTGRRIEYIGVELLTAHEAVFLGLGAGIALTSFRGTGVPRFRAGLSALRAGAFTRTVVTRAFRRIAQHFDCLGDRHETIVRIWQGAYIGVALLCQNASGRAYRIRIRGVRKAARAVEVHFAIMLDNKDNGS